MKKEQRDIACSPRGQATNAIFYPESATRQFSRYSAFDLGVVFMSRRVPHICEPQAYFVRSLDVSRDRLRREPLSVIIGTLSAIDRNHRPPSIGRGVRNRRNPHAAPEVPEVPFGPGERARHSRSEWALIVQ
jgi:hypothetical protein